MIYAYGSTTPLNVLGTFTTVVESRCRLTFAMFYIVKAGNGSLLSCKTAQELDLIRLNVSSIDTKVNKLPSKAQSTPQHTKSTLPSITYLPKCLNITASPKTHDLVSRYQHLSGCWQRRSEGLPTMQRAKFRFITHYRFFVMCRHFSVGFR